jgi:predicted DNA-binding transcriptional regulator YafY
MKMERLISMIYMLLNNEVVSASSLAEKYDVSQRTIYRDIDVICAAGIPVVSYQGVNGGYGIIETYKMDKSLLGSYDIGSLITILHSVSLR